MSPSFNPSRPWSSTVPSVALTFPTSTRNDPVSESSVYSPEPLVPACRSTVFALRFPAEQVSTVSTPMHTRPARDSTLISAGSSGKPPAVLILVGSKATRATLSTDNPLMTSMLPVVIVSPAPVPVAVSDRLFPDFKSPRVSDFALTRAFSAPVCAEERTNPAAPEGVTTLPSNELIVTDPLFAITVLCVVTPSVPEIEIVRLALTPATLTDCPLNSMS